MKLACLLICFFLQSFVYSHYSADLNKFPCHKYFKVIDDWPDGFRGKLKLPVVDNLFLQLPEVMKNGHVIITFNKPIRTLDIPDGDMARRRVYGNMEYHIFMGSLSKLMRLRPGNIFELEISVHYDRRYANGQIGISAIDFGSFNAPLAPPTPQLPKCAELIQMIDNSSPDGYRAEIRIPVQRAMTSWEMEIGFTRRVLVLDVPQGISQPQRRNVKYFYISNREYNGFIRAHSTFKLEFMVHFDRNRVEKKAMKINFIKFGNCVHCSG